MNMFRSNLEKDFEYFVRHIGKLEAVEFCGLAKILGVEMTRRLDVSKIDIEKLKENLDEEIEELQGEYIVPLDEVFEKMMDRFLELPRRRRKEINQILKDVKRGK